MHCGYTKRAIRPSSYTGLYKDGM